MQNDELLKKYIIENPIISESKIIGNIYENPELLQDVS